MRSERATRDPVGYAIRAWGGVRVRPTFRPWRIGALRRLVRRAIDEAGQAGVRVQHWPDNLVCGPRAHGDVVHQPDEIRVLYARMAGWIRALPRYPILRRLFCRGLSPYGMGSPKTLIDPWALVVRWRSPGRLNRWLGAVVRRADLVLRPWGLAASWAAVAWSLRSDRCPRRIGKAAIRIAADTLRDALGDTGLVIGYRQARDYLAAHGRSIAAGRPHRDGEKLIVRTDGPPRPGWAWANRVETWVRVIDTTTGQPHELRVPPLYGLPLRDGETWGDRIHGAVSWTFDLAPRAYMPTAES